MYKFAGNWYFIDDLLHFCVDSEKLFQINEVARGKHYFCINKYIFSETVHRVSDLTVLRCLH